MADASGLYVDEADVEAELSHTIGAATKPSSTQLDQMIDDIEAEYNAVLYAVGVTVASIDEDDTPIVFKVSRQTCLWGVCSRVIAAAGGLVMGKGEKEEDYWDRFQLKLAAIKENPAFLGSDAPFSTSASRIGIHYSPMDGDDNYVESEFTRTTEY